MSPTNCGTTATSATCTALPVAATRGSSHGTSHVCVNCSTLVSELTLRRAPHELMLFPEERHLPRGLDGRAHTKLRVVHFLARELGVPLP